MDTPQSKENIVTKDNNIFKYKYTVSIFILLLLIGGYYYSNNQKKQMSAPENTSETKLSDKIENDTKEATNIDWSEYTPSANEKQELINSSRVYISGMLSGDPVKVKSVLINMTKASIDFLTAEEKAKAIEEDMKSMSVKEAEEYSSLIKPIITKENLEKLSNSYFISEKEKVVFYKKGSQWGTNIDISLEKNSITSSVWIVYTKDENGVFNIMNFQSS